ncbi:hypothetical protein TPHA_0H02810 [Tetrapisispora phaffii CBS 4417]|uniref:Uncharacterized protein n=1 Tax=Tetrapisispora phaffii (strain ATCC 24235 / CBS 4417 / NBRC 1672 / NRRL Y-8282 / UCD 70-5) TaxID=1071381 RepID=G8BWN3_TETPH|nr:hypothetical protein TPHA_0H02810 [Tetrapisispora phaffii CBS 4417]CCE64484.1 hypothetical protein TPHA_0H02810 [Tetrapisispora phaffii CBS 4417]
MDFNENYHLSQQQVCLDRLDNQVFFSSVSSLLHNPNLITENNIRYLFTTGISINDFIATIYNNDNELLKNIANNLCIINLDTLDSVAGQQFQYSYSDDVQAFKRHHTQKLQDIISYLVNDIEQRVNGKMNNNTDDNSINRYLSPIPDKVNLSSILYGDVSYYYGSNEFNDSDINRFKTFNDLLTILKTYNQREKALIISQDGNDYNMIAYLISTVLKLNPSYNIYEALRHLKCLTENFEELNNERIIWYSGLLSYYELIRANELYWGNVNVNSLNSTKTNMNFANANTCATNSRSSSISPNKRRDSNNIATAITQPTPVTQSSPILSSNKRSRLID